MHNLIFICLFKDANMELSTICILPMSLKSIQGSFLLLLMGGKKKKRYRCVKQHLFSPLGIISSRMPVTAQKGALLKGVNVYKMELNAVLIVMEVSLVITS